MNNYHKSYEISNTATLPTRFHILLFLIMMYIKCNVKILIFLVTHIKLWQFKPNMLFPIQFHMVLFIANCQILKNVKIKNFLKFLSSLILSKIYGEIRLEIDANALFVESILVKKKDCSRFV